MYAQIPSIEKMDASLSTLAACEKLSLSTNQIEKIANLNGLSMYLRPYYTLKMISFISSQKFAHGDKFV